MGETKDLTGPLLKMLKQMGVEAFRMQSGALQKGPYWIHLCPEGTADILCFPRNRPVTWLETKDPAGATRKSRKEAQAAFRERVEALGHKYVIARTIDEGLEALR